MSEHNEESASNDSDFLVVAHQIQSPLSAVKWLLSMLYNGDAGKLTNSQMELVKKATKSNDRAIRLIQEVLSVNRLQSGRVELSLVSTPILDVIQNSINELSSVAKEKSIKIVLKDFDGESPLVMIDREKIRNAFENLLDNSIKYTKENGLVMVSVHKEDSDIMITVDDSGIGIPEEDEEKIFNKFYRGARARTSGTEGTGLGLFIARSIIEKHGGKVWFEDKKRDLHMSKSGARFNFTIPLKNG